MPDSDLKFWRPDARQRREKEAGGHSKLLCIFLSDKKYALASSLETSLKRDSRGLYMHLSSLSMRLCYIEIGLRSLHTIIAPQMLS